MAKLISRGFAAFVAIVITGALMKLFGQPLIDLIPPGGWALEWVLSAIPLLGTADAVFWLLAITLALVAWSLIRLRFLSGRSAAVVTGSVAAGLLTGCVYRLSHLNDPVLNVAADPAFWLLVTGAVAPIVIAAVKFAIGEVQWRRRGRKAQQVGEGAGASWPAAPLAVKPVGGAS